jgi:hypothetical protein
MFTKLIESSLASKATKLNFFIHNLAQLKPSGASPATPGTANLLGVFFAVLFKLF